MYDYEDRKLRLRSRVPWVTVDEILAEREWQPLVAPEVEVIEPPTESELLVIRTELDTRGQTMDAAGDWIIWDGGEYLRQKV